jgi:hypothetical protein
MLLNQKNYALLLLIMLLGNACKSKKNNTISTENQEYASRIETIKPIVVDDLQSCEAMNFPNEVSSTAEYTSFDGIPDTDG